MQQIELPKAVFWDWDGTLVDSFAFLHKTHNHVRGIFGMEPFDVEVFRGYFGRPREELYREIYGAERIEEAKQHFESYVLANNHEIQAIDGAQNLLKFFAHEGIPMGIVTNKKGALVRQEIQNHGWQDYFIAVVGAGEANEDKPSPAPLLLALEQSGLDITPEDIWFVGDTENDLACGQSAGASCIFLESPEPHVGLIEKYDPILNFKNCREFSDFLLQMPRKSIKTA